MSGLGSGYYHDRRKEKEMFAKNEPLHESNPLRTKSGPYCGVCGASIILKNDNFYCPYCKKYMD